MTTDSYIILEDLRLFAYHGMAEQEHKVGNEYRIDIRLHVNITRAAQTDNVADTVNYAEVFETVKTEMKTPSKLLENVAGRIANALLAHFPQTTGIDLVLRKRNPPMGADIAWTGVELHIQRDGSIKNDLRART